eukprot:m.317528 g.317528  ORF g.317528 m.317528 type:complete len:405 (-) comp16509_c1_seq5:1380-2594(-)
MALITDATIDSLRLNDEDVETITSEQQLEVEEACSELLEELKHGSIVIRSEEPSLLRQNHIQYLQRGLQGLGRGYSGLDASRPWLIYWIIHSLELLGCELDSQQQASCIDTLSRCQHPGGGFGGGPGQDAHLAPTYAAVNALATIGTEAALSIIDRPKLKSFITSLRTQEGAFCMHIDGECDVRGAYCAVSVAFLTNIASVEMFVGTAQWIARCQNYEGGISAVPGDEAHGGYAFCGLAALVILDSVNLIDIESLLTWAVFRQRSLEGGFQGRSNKLVDGCYSFWVGGVFPLIHQCLFHREEPTHDGDGLYLFSQSALQDYIFYCCQEMGGGLRDKPGKGRDYYHTCYCLSGLSVSQHHHQFCSKPMSYSASDLLTPTHPTYNISVPKAKFAEGYFQSRSPLPI